MSGNFLNLSKLHFFVRKKCGQYNLLQKEIVNLHEIVHVEIAGRLGKCSINSPWFLSPLYLLE
jgi:hypothetical protein